MRQVGRHRLPRGPQPVVRVKEPAVSVDVGRPARPLDPGVGRPHQAPFALEKVLHVVAVADVINRPVRRESSTNGWPWRGSSSSRPASETDTASGRPLCRAAPCPGRNSPLPRARTGSPCPRGARTPETSPASRRRRSGPGSLRMAVAVELGQMDDLDAQPLEHPDEVGSGRRGPACFRLMRRLGDGHVPVAGHRVIARQLRESVAVRVTQRLLECLLGVAAGKQIENAQTLLGAGRGIEPGNERPAPLLCLADAEAETVIEPAMIAAVPDRLQVVRQVPREKILMRRRKTGDRAGSRLPRSASGAGPPDGDPCRRRPARRARAFLRCRPRRNRILPRRFQRQPGVVEDGSPIFVGVDDGLDVNQPGAAIDVQPQLARERTGRDLADRDRRRCALLTPPARASGSRLAR